MCKTIAVGLLDRVVHGVTAVEMMKACDEAAHKILIEENPTNPQISISQVRQSFSYNETTPNGLSLLDNEINLILLIIISSDRI